jgi:hypothetical protein
MTKLFILKSIATSILIFSFTVNNVDGPKVYKEFNGGRDFFAYLNLKLYDNSVFSYHALYDFGSDKDSGNWKILDTLLILNSYPRIEERKIYYDKRTKRKLKLTNDFKIEIDTIINFRNDTFLYKNNKVFLFNFKDLKDKDDSSYNFSYNVLYEVQEK